MIDHDGNLVLLLVTLAVFVIVGGAIVLVVIQDARSAQERSSRALRGRPASAHTDAPKPRENGGERSWHA